MGTHAAARLALPRHISSGFRWTDQVMCMYPVYSQFRKVMDAWCYTIGYYYTLFRPRVISIKTIRVIDCANVHTFSLPLLSLYETHNNVVPNYYFRK